MGLQEPYKVQQGQMQSPVCGKEEPLAGTQAGGWRGWREQLCGKGHGGVREDVSQKCTLAAKEANSVLCCITSHKISRPREVIVHYSALARSHPRTTS